MKTNRVVLGFSGGVDSTAASLLLKDNGFSVHGLYLDVLPGGPSKEALEAENRARELGIAFTRLDVSKVFDETVIADFCDSYKRGETPNPCILCNPEIKFRYLFQAADELGAFYVATGHYARMTDGYIQRAAAADKDQSYMLWKLIGRYDFSRILFPLGEFSSKEEVRSFVEEKGIGNFGKKDSQDICFIPKSVPYTEFLAKKGISTEPGTFVDREGKYLADSRGYLNYTIGQRKGFGIGFGKPMFVTKLDPVGNRVFLGEEEELFRTGIKVRDVILTEKYSCQPLSCTGKIRYHSLPCSCSYENNLVTLDKPGRAPTPGQSLVFYDGDRLIGGAIIEE